MAKYADQPTMEVDVTIEAGVDAIWPIVTDIDLPARFSPEFQGARWVSDGPALGAVFEGTNRHEFVGEWTTTCTVTGYEEGHVFEWTVGDLANKTARWRFELEDIGEGILLRFIAEMGPGPSGVTYAIGQRPSHEEEIVSNRLREWERNMILTLGGIKALAEEHHAASG